MLQHCYIYIFWLTRHYSDKALEICIISFVSKCVWLNEGSNSQLWRSLVSAGFRIRLFLKQWFLKNLFTFSQSQKLYGMFHYFIFAICSITIVWIHVPITHMGKLSVLDLYAFSFFFCFPVFWFSVLINLFARISENITKHGAIRVLRLVQCQTIRTGCLVIYLYSIAEITCWVFFSMTCLSLLFFFGTLQIN